MKNSHGESYHILVDKRHVFSPVFGNVELQLRLRALLDWTDLHNHPEAARFLLGNPLFVAEQPRSEIVVLAHSSSSSPAHSSSSSSSCATASHDGASITSRSRDFANDSDHDDDDDHHHDRDGLQDVCYRGVVPDAMVASNPANPPAVDESLSPPRTPELSTLLSPVAEESLSPPRTPELSTPVSPVAEESLSVPRTPEFLTSALDDDDDAAAGDVAANAEPSNPMFEDEPVEVDYGDGPLDDLSPATPLEPLSVESVLRPNGKHAISVEALVDHTESHSERM